jgi:hypothetical protein
LRLCRFCGEQFEPSAPRQFYCERHGGFGKIDDPLEAGPPPGQLSMRPGDFPDQTYLDVRLRILQQNVPPSGELFMARMRAVGDAARNADAPALRGALSDLAAIAIQAAGHKDVLRVMGIRPPVIPTRRRG